MTKRSARAAAAILAFVLVLALTTGAATATTGSGHVVAAARSGVVRIYAVDKNGDAFVGSAFGVGRPGETPTYFVTNHHVVSDEDGGPMASVYILKDAIGENESALSKLVRCEIVYRDDNGAPDLAVLKASEPVAGRTTLPLLSVNGNLDAGDTVYALGYPASADMTSNGMLGAVEDVTVTNGIVSRLAEYAPMENIRIIQHTAAINGGNSGGPLINAEGAVVGVNTFYFNANGLGSDEVNHFGSIETEYVMDMLDSLGITYTVYTPEDPNKDPGGDPSKDPVKDPVKEPGREPDKEPDKDPVKDPDGISPVMIGVIAGAAVAVIAVVAVMALRKPKQATAAQSGQPQAHDQFGQTGQPQVPGQFGQPVQPQTPVQPQAPVQAAPAQAVPVIAGDTGLRIQGLAGQFAGRRFAIAGQLRIGRDPARNDLVYPAGSQGVSGAHCVLVADGGRMLLQDLGSTYGTYVGGNRLAANTPVELRVGDRFCLGSERETFVIARKGEV